MKLKLALTLLALSAAFARGGALTSTRAIDAPGGRYTPGAALAVTVTITKDAANLERVTGLYLNETLPEGWVLTQVLSTGHEPQLAPALNTTNRLELIWVDIPSFPCVVRYTATAPAAAVSNAVFSGAIKWTVLGNDQPSATTGGHGLLACRAFHSADLDRDYTISRAELDRVIAFYMAGEYSIDPAAGDGYTPGPGSRDGFTHDSDLNGDWSIAMRGELFRAVQLHNAESYFLNGDRFDPTAFYPVATITGIPAAAKIGVDLVLNGTVLPPEANQTIVWSVFDDPDATGADFADGNRLTGATAPGVVTVRATIANGAGTGTDYEQDFGITFSFDYLEYLVIDLSGGPATNQYPVTFLNAIPAGGWTPEHKTTKLVMRRVAAGTFDMGSPATEPGRGTDEDQFEATLTQDYYIGVFQVTQKQWELVMGPHASFFTVNGDTRPKEGVSYDTVRGGNWPASNTIATDTFIKRIRDKTPLPGFDLPTEAQWEYACRDGTDGAFNFGAADPDDNMRYYYTSGEDFFPAPSANTNLATAVVGSYPPSPVLGLYDMHGNVHEWCRDWYWAYPAVPTDDPEGESTGLGFNRVIRGGAWNSLSNSCRSAARSEVSPGTANDHIGFRPVWPAP